MLRSFAIQAIIFLVAFQLISFLRETSMLSTDTVLTDLVTTNLHVDIDKVPTLMGETVSLNAQGKTTILYFFAPWCQVCHASIGNLQALYQKNEQLDVIAIAMDFTENKEVMAFTSQHQLTFPIALGNEAIKHIFEISGYPSYYVLNEENVIIGKSMGYSSELGLYLRSL
ncbi:TlpA family protein disulfide reductase [Colwellia psychrerythraea]|uniref:Alkyl hydroperoxide reductase/ Thiol specific antioxidant/ Mal allergen n=1 Tax=Colwellia psychrerythraea TaxID=28229 RepID=A0A099KUB9_COLPS|nr:TlpA disulfide reductase family protein [Colwellia psychrerythraea]KGJ93790.1 alkyl hydroperoxide reductase/ Thiol specific antioxidant/ Mal allergen [Colwellia psychrerythraea]